MGGCRWGPDRCRGSDALIDEIAVGGWRETDADPEKPVERAVHVPPPVPSERHELVEVALDVALAEAVEGALRPPFEVREDAVDPMQEFVRLPALDDPHLMGVCGRALVAEPAVGDDVHAGAT